MKPIFIVTGAKGHLGGTLVRMLEDIDCEVRGLVLAGQAACPHGNVRYLEGDVRRAESLRPLFESAAGREITVFHTAGLIDISEHVSPLLYDVNVNGTKNVLALCQEYNVKRLVYVSSVHAIPEGEKDSVLAEKAHFSPDSVVGGYAKTKAEATQAVLDAAAGGLDAVIVQPSGILGPYDESGNHLVQLVTNFVLGSASCCVKGGYDFVDVRDVAKGCLLAAEKGRSGECYILSNRHYEVQDVLRMAGRVSGGRKPRMLPTWLAKAALPFIQWRARRKHQRPLYTHYSLHTLHANDKFSHDKATAELGYRPRDLGQTLKDTVQWALRRKAAAPSP